MSTVLKAGEYTKGPATVLLASSWIALSGVPYWIGAGVGQLMTGVVCAAPEPIPVSVADTGKLPALFIRLRDALKAPALAGLNVTMMVQVPPGGRPNPPTA